MYSDDDDEPMGHWGLIKFRMRLRWLRLRDWWRYRVLHRPRPGRGFGGCVDLSSLTEMYKRVYAPDAVDEIANRPHPLFDALKKEP